MMFSSTAFLQSSSWYLQNRLPSVNQKETKKKKNWSKPKCSTFWRWSSDLWFPWKPLLNFRRQPSGFASTETLTKKSEVEMEERRCGQWPARLTRFSDGVYLGPKESDLCGLSMNSTKSIRRAFRTVGRPHRQLSASWVPITGTVRLQSDER